MTTKIEEVARARGFESVEDLMMDAALTCDASAKQMARHLDCAPDTIRSAAVKFCGGMKKLRKDAAEVRWLSELDDKGNHPSECEI